MKGFLGIRWSVGRKLGLAFGGVVCFLLGTSIVALHAIGNLTRDHDRVVKTLPVLATADADRISRANDSFHATASSTRLLIVAATIAGALLAVGVALWITLALRMRVRRVLSRLQHLRDDDVRVLADGLEAVATGDMTVEVRTSTRPIQRISSDEIGEVSLAVNAIHETTLTSLDAYNRMRARVARILAEIAHSSASVAAASQQMATTLEETGRAIGEIATTVNEVAQGAERQVRSVTEGDGVASSGSSRTARGRRRTARRRSSRRAPRSSGSAARSTTCTSGSSESPPRSSRLPRAPGACRSRWPRSPRSPSSPRPRASRCPPPRSRPPPPPSRSPPPRKSWRRRRRSSISSSANSRSSDQARVLPVRLRLDAGGRAFRPALETRAVMDRR